MNQYENMNLEFKEIYVPEIKKEIIAFANTEGGSLYVGIRKDGTVVGINNPDEVMLQIANSLKDAIRPDVMPFVKIKTTTIEEKNVIEITIDVGSNRPYYLQEKGLKPNGVYVRKGSSSQPLSEEGIREMIVENSGKSYESCRSMNQNLTFHTLEEEMKKRNLEISPVQMRTLHLIDENGLYSNLALLLSDQCEHTIKVAIFQGNDKSIFRDRKEFQGSLLKQLNETFQLIDLFNKTNATFSGLERMDKRDYPLEAIREALLNSIVHRDYSFSGSTLIHLYEDRIEFVSLGGLVSGLSIEAIFMGVSQSRNVNLANIFYRMRLIESYGTGIGKIQRLYNEEIEQPEFNTAKGVFRVILPNCNNYNEKSSKVKILQSSKSLNQTIDDKTRILQLAKKNGQIKRKEIEETLDLKQTKAFYLLKQLCSENKLCIINKGKNTYYQLVEMHSQQ